MPTSPPTQILGIDFFCGAGGLTRGLTRAGIAVRAGVDNDESLRDTYSKNNPDSRFIRRDICDLNIYALRRLLGFTDDSRVVYAACTPCQPFSTLNQRRGEDDRKNLLLVFGAIVERCPPDVIVIENVPGLNTKYGKDIYEKFLETIQKVGFGKANISSAFLDANQFNVPQIRKRFILLASRHGKISLPEPIEPRPTVADWIGKYPELKHGEASDEYFNHKCRKLRPHHLKIVKAVPPNGGSRKDIEDTSILLKCHQENPDAHKDVFGRMKWESPAPTLTCRCTDVYCGRFVHPDQDRGISIREAAALQTFPDDYKFHGDSILQLARQIGNSVPVNFAAELGKAIRQHFSELQDPPSSS